MSYMVNLVVEGKSAVVIGGGEVAARKVQDLVAARACVTVIAPHPSDPIHALAKAGRIALHLRPYAADDLTGAFIAIAATDDEDVNRRVAADAARLNVLVNVVDRPALCAFTAPATVCRGDLTLAVATQGRCPALAGILREELEQRYGPEYAGLVSLFGELRDRMIFAAGRIGFASSGNLLAGWNLTRTSANDSVLEYETSAIHASFGGGASRASHPGATGPCPSKSGNSATSDWARPWCGRAGNARSDASRLGGSTGTAFFHSPTVRGPSSHKRSH
jgi:precorrin-2 dehydrogenase/sirohydrochlorin ferrochelatase